MSTSNLSSLIPLKPVTTSTNCADQHRTSWPHFHSSSLKPMATLAMIVLLIGLAIAMASAAPLNSDSLGQYGSGSSSETRGLVDYDNMSKCNHCMLVEKPLEIYSKLIQLKRNSKIVFNTFSLYDLHQLALLELWNYFKELFQHFPVEFAVQRMHSLFRTNVTMNHLKSI